MKHLKIILLLMVILISFGISAQTVRTINAKIEPNTAYKEESAEYKAYTAILTKLIEGEKTLDKLTKEEARIMKKYDSYYPDGYDELTKSPWNVHEPGCSWYCGANYETRVSSSLASIGGNDYTVKSIDDDDVRTAWVEGAKGYGVGEYMEFIFNYNAPRATTFTLSNGYNKSVETWKKNSRVKTLNIYENDKLIQIVNLADTRDLQTFELPHPIPNRKDGERGLPENDNKPSVRLKMMISEVYKGDKYDDTAISEILFDGMDVHCLLEGTMITMANKKPLAIEKIKEGQQVLAWNPAKKKAEKQTVVKIHSVKHSPSEMITIHFQLDKKTTLSMTADHPLYSITGWVSANPSATINYKRYEGVNVGNLDSNTILYRITLNGDLRKKKIDGITDFKSRDGAMVNTYTLELDGNGVFFANGFAVGQE